jgi:hypothetical protein
MGAMLARASQSETASMFSWHNMPTKSVGMASGFGKWY